MSAEVITTSIYLLVVFTMVIIAIPQWGDAGKEYLEHVFSDPDRAEAVNRLLVTGISLITLAIALLLVGIGSPDTPTDSVTTLFRRLAALLTLVGVAYLANLGAYGYLGSRIKEEQEEDEAAEQRDTESITAESITAESTTAQSTTAQSTTAESTAVEAQR